FPIWSCSVRGLACHCCYQQRGGLLPHLFTRSQVAPGGLFSVPLSVGSPRPGVTRRTALWSSDFPLPADLPTIAREGEGGCFDQQRSPGSLRRFNCTGLRLTAYGLSIRF